MAAKYVFTDYNDDRLNVEAGSDGSAFISTNDHLAVAIPPTQILGVLVSIAGAVGLDVILLDRLGGDEHRIGEHDIIREGTDITLGGKPTSIAEARLLSRVLASMADAAEAEPEPEEIRALVETLRDVQHRMAGDQGDRMWESARLLLLAGYRREA